MKYQILGWEVAGAMHAAAGMLKNHMSAPTLILAQTLSNLWEPTDGNFTHSDQPQNTCSWKGFFLSHSKERSGSRLKTEAVQMIVKMGVLLLVGGL